MIIQLQLSGAKHGDMNNVEDLILGKWKCYKSTIVSENQQNTPLRVLCLLTYCKVFLLQRTMRIDGEI